MLAGLAQVRGGLIWASILLTSRNVCEQRVLHLFGSPSADRERGSVVELDGILLERDRICKIRDIAPVAAHEAVRQLGHEVIELGVGLKLACLAVDGDLAQVAAEVGDRGSVDELLLVAVLDAQH